MPTDTLIAISFNGEAHDVLVGQTVKDMLRRAGIDPEQSGIAVARNGAVVRRADWGETEVEAGDELEIITATQGG